ncbi:tRNA lysidine(34) synthetase TilS [Primorskyibacter sp. 2E107]|uniref:tRNA lysidine(34) synthetase TilS n=1 Tax=Primorskyibacter sp. 2E107 TaxID=3403458 RepID=UPI003AF7C19C
MTREARSLDQQFADAMGDLLGPDFPEDIALAVSGGGDSMAMLTLAHNWTHRWGVRLWVVTVDHGLRPESAAEAEMVAEECRTLGHPHATLRWDWDGQGNVMDAARRARLGLIEQWRGGINHVLMAHTRDDIAETLLMRLARGSGVEGLSAMQARRRVLPATTPGVITGDSPPQPATRRAGFEVIRPCLSMGREALRHYLRTLKGRWVDDPSNEDPRYDRARLRQQIAALGLDPQGLAETARRMDRARGALQARAAQVWGEIGREDRAGSVATGDLLLDRTGFEAIERDTQLRLLAGALQYIATADYRPRAEPLEALLERLLGGGGGTLHGCEARAERDVIRVFREFRAVAQVTQSVGEAGLWDGRWHVLGDASHGKTIRALGENGWQQLKQRPDGAPPYHAARSLPSIWDGDRLLACDALGFGPGTTTRLWPMGKELFSVEAFLLSH